MESHKIYIRKKLRKNGFTLIEILTVVSVFILMSGVTLEWSQRNLTHSSFRDERNKLIATLLKARSDASHSMCYGITCTSSVSHGVYFDTHSYTIFQGNYTPGDEQNISTQLPTNYTLSGLQNVIFEKNSGKATTSPSNVTNLTLTDSEGNISIITVGNEGTVEWNK